MCEKTSALFLPSSTSEVGLGIEKTQPSELEQRGQDYD